MRFLRSRKVLKDDDASIIKAFRETQDVVYLEVFFNRYSHLVFAVSMKYLKNEEESKDVVLHLFERLSSDLNKYHVEHFSNWLFTVTKNHCLRLLKNRTYNN